jgi:hypothetical protein
MSHAAREAQLHMSLKHFDLGAVTLFTTFIMSGELLVSSDKALVQIHFHLHLKLRL